MGPTYFVSGQLSTSSPQDALPLFQRRFFKSESFTPTELIIEDYRVYQNRTEQHAGSSLSTPRLIGMLETLCLQHEVPWHKILAQFPKQFVTDDKLREWGLWQKGQRHARDAIRHACYHILFPPKVLSSQAVMKSKTAGQHVG